MPHHHLMGHPYKLWGPMDGMRACGRLPGWHRHHTYVRTYVRSTTSSIIQNSIIHIYIYHQPTHAQKVVKIHLTAYVSKITDMLTRRSVVSGLRSLGLSCRASCRGRVGQGQQSSSLRALGRDAYREQQTPRRNLSSTRHSKEFTTTGITPPLSLSDRGLFGLRGLHTAKDFISLAERCIVRCDAIRAELRERLDVSQSSSTPPDIVDTLYTLSLLDSISNEVCRVIDAAELCRNVHAQLAYRNAAEKAFHILSGYISQLNADVTLYTSVVSIVEGHSGSGSTNTNTRCTSTITGPNKSASFSLLTEEQQLVALDLRREFEADGIHFGLLAAEGAPQASKYKKTSQRLAALQAEVTAHETSFMQAAASADNALFLIGPFGATLPAETIQPSSSSSATDTASARAKIAKSRAPELRAFGSQVRQWLGQHAPQDIDALKRDYTRGTSSASDSGSDSSMVSVLKHVFGNDNDSNNGNDNTRYFPDTDGEYAVCTSRKHISRSLLVSLHPSEVRGQVWSGSVGEPKDNRAGLGALVRSRQALASELGYSSFAEKVLSNSVAGNENDVWSFLENAAKTVRPYAEEELASLQQLAGEDVQPWDISYWSHMQRARVAQAGAASAERVSEYFPLNVAVDALIDMTESLFGLRLRRGEISALEDWVSTAAGGGGSDESSGAFKLLLEDFDGTQRGTVYMDLHQRADKFTGAAHFTVQCGCAHSDMVPSYEGGTSRKVAGGKTGLQLPVVALVFNFPAVNDGPPLLSLGDLTTLFHEWGHALHSLLSQTTYQHLSGTRGPLDFVEVPSHLFEALSTDVRCLRRWARHYSTGESPPAGLLEEALAAKRSFEALEASTQVLYSLTDQHIFGRRMGSVAGMSDEQVYMHAVQAALALQREYTSLPVAHLGGSSTNTHSNFYVRRTANDIGIPGSTHHPALYLPSHSHFVTYGGGYYAYLYAKMCAAQIWERHFEQDPLSRNAGEHLWHNLLRYGVSRKPSDTLVDMLGGPLEPRHYFHGIGLGGGGR